MSIKIIGAVLIVVACGGFGFCIASAHLREEKYLRQLVMLLEYMECELQYRLTPLPDLCRQASGQGSSNLHRAFNYLAVELEDQIAPDVDRCMAAALSKTGDLPQYTRNAMNLLGKSLGRFDVEGQLKGLDMVQNQCRLDLERLCQNKDARLKSYQTLGLCAGAAMAILLI